jgi:hypothetical protein
VTSPMPERSEPSNPFYFLLLITGVVLTVNALALAVVPVLEKRWDDEGELPPASPFRDALREDGWKWLLAEVSLLIVFGLASMGLDRYRRYRQEHAGTAAPPVEQPHSGKEERKTLS